MITSEQLAAGRNALAAAGYAIAQGAAKTKFAAGESLTAGTYIPEFGIGTPVPALLMPARGKNGRAFAALSFKCGERTVKISVSSFYNSIRVVAGANPATLAQDAKWAGEAAQPTANYYRYGGISDMPSEDVPSEDGNGTVAMYVPTAFTLTTEVVYVAPRFVEGSNTPVFDEQCSLRKALVVADYQKFPDTNARR